MSELDFLNLALTWVAAPSEAEWRSAVSRAYYAAFHVARHLLIELGFTVPPDESAHRYLAYRLTNCGHQTVANAGNNLNVLRKDRGWADYSLARPLRQSTAQTQVDAARQIIQDLDSARLDPTRTQITDAMKIYERDVLQNVTWHP